MKNFGRNPILSFGGLLLAAAVWLFAATSQAATPGAAQVKKVVGSASYTDAKGNGPLKEGDILFQGATITTGAGSYVDLFLGVNGDALRIEADSTLSLSKLDYTKGLGETVVNTEIEVKKGAAVANVINKLSKASKYEIKTPSGVAGIRGTVVRAGVNRVVCLIGRVEFRTAGGQLQLVVGGMAVTVGGGVVKAATVETSGLARTATSMTANTVANMVNQVVQQFTAALAAEAAVEAAKVGADPAQAAAAAAKGIMVELVQAVKQAAADVQASPAVRAAAQAAANNLEAKSESVQATAAASAAAAAVVATGGTAQQAKTAANVAAAASTADTKVATAAANNVTTVAINTAIQNRNQGGTQGGVIEKLVEATKPAAPPGPPIPGSGPKQDAKPTVDTKVGETVISGTVGK